MSLPAPLTPASAASGVGVRAQRNGGRVRERERAGVRPGIEPQGEQDGGHAQEAGPQPLKNTQIITVLHRVQNFTVIDGYIYFVYVCVCVRKHFILFVSSSSRVLFTGLFNVQMWIGISTINN